MRHVDIGVADPAVLDIDGDVVRTGLSPLDAEGGELSARVGGGVGVYVGHGGYLDPVSSVSALPLTAAFFRRTPYSAVIALASKLIWIIWTPISGGPWDSWFTGAPGALPAATESAP